MSRKPFALLLVGACSVALTGVASAQAPRPRVSSTQKGSLLIYSKIEIKWDLNGDVTQDTILDMSNDYPADVVVKGYFINGDLELEQRCSGEPCGDGIDDTVIQTFEPGWNTADCKFTLTANQPHFWSAVDGSDKCQSFTVLDSDGRLDPETQGSSRILRGYALFYAVKFIAEAPEHGQFVEIRWNHLKGDAVLVNYANGTAWEYNAWAFQAHQSTSGEAPHGGPLRRPSGQLDLDGVEYDIPFSELTLDFYGTGTTALSGGDQTVMTDTDLTVHAVSADLRQDGCGPVLTKIEAEIWNEFETKFSGTRRCICCWDQTMLSNWVRSEAIPNHFKRSTLRTDKGKARLKGVGSDECDFGVDNGDDYVSGYELYCGPTAAFKRRHGECPKKIEIGGNWHGQSEDASILALATKFMTFSPSGDQATAGMNVVGAGEYPAVILTDVQEGPEELRDGRTNRTGSASGKGTSSDRGSDVREVIGE